MSPSRVAAGLLFLGLVAAACAPPRLPLARVSPKPSPSPLPPAHITWTACSPAGWQCGKLTVPLDYADPTGSTIQLALNRKVATDPRHRIGSLLINPGGPGISGTSFAVDAYDHYKNLTPYFDLVGFDPRGVGQSAPVKCVSDSALDAFNAADAEPDDPGELQKLVNVAQQLAAACRAKNGPVLEHVDTVTAARDMDRMREALGDAKITYFGYSYGTYLGDTYAHLFPTHIRALVLDSVLDPDIDETTLIGVQAEGFERNLDDYLAGCVKTSTPACPFHGAGLKGQLEAFLEGLDSTPMRVGARQLNSTLALTGILFALYQAPSSFPYLSLALDRAEGGDGSVLLRFADAYLERDASGHYSNSIEANYAINCLDHPVPAARDYFATRAQQLAKMAPVFGKFVAYSDLPCRYWPYPPTGRPAPLDAVGAPPIVLVGNTGDPATPYAWAQAVHHELTASILITRTGDGHGGYDVSSCVRQQVDAYLVHLTVPADGLTCPSD